MKYKLLPILILLTSFSFAQIDPSTIEANTGYFQNINTDQISSGYIESYIIKIDNKDLGDRILFASATYDLNFSSSVNIDRSQTIITNTGVRFDFLSPLNPTRPPVCIASSMSDFAIPKVTTAFNHVSIEFVSLQGQIIRPKFSLACFP